MSYLEDAFEIWLSQTDLPEPEREYRFAPPRRWRFDFAWPEHKVAVEIEGGLFKGGRHQSLDGFLKDAEKYEAALLKGWTVYRCPGPWIAEGSARNHRMIWREQVMETLRLLLAQGSGRRL